MKILKLSPYYYPEQVSSSHLSDDLEEALVKEGIDIEIYAPIPTRGISDETRKKYKKIKFEEFQQGHIKLYRFNMFPEKINPVVRGLRYILVNIVQYFKASSAKNIDIIYAASTPPTQGLLCALVKKKLTRRYGHDVKYVYNLQDVFPDSLVYTGLCKESSILYKIGDKIMNYTYNNADKIIVISEEFKKVLLRKGISEDKIEVIYNWIDENKIQYIPRKNNKLFDEYDLDRNKFYIAYSGNIGLTQNMDMLLEIAEHIKENKNIGIILVGEGAYREQVEKIIKGKSLDNVILIPFQPYERISEVFSLGNMSLIISKKGVAKNSLPSKTWGYMSAKRPILASFDTDSELTRIIEKNECGVCVEADDAKTLEKVIVELSKLDSTKLDDMGNNGRKYIIQNITKEVCTSKYINVFKFDTDR